MSHEKTTLMDRLVPSPVFILSPVRAGSTLLRSILDSHSHIHAPLELHLTLLTVHASDYLISCALDTLGVTTREIEHLLWDRMLHHELIRSGKQILVEKTPGNVLSWRRIAECWPDAKYIFLIRHPAHIAASLARDWGEHIAVDKVLILACRLDEARAELPGLTVRYEDLTTRPEEVVRQLCAFLGVPWEPDMLDYGRFDHGPYIPGIGDWSENIRSGHIKPPAAMPAFDEIPKALKEYCRSWGYLDSPLQPRSTEPRPANEIREWPIQPRELPDIPQRKTKVMDRLVSSPVFIFSPMRAGSTLLRCVLGSNSHVHAPHELHLPLLTVQVSDVLARCALDTLDKLGITTRGIQQASEVYVRNALDALCMTTGDLDHLLWDRILHHELVRSGKKVFVEKTAFNVLSWRRIAECWPDAKYIFLIRHPAHIATSLARTNGEHNAIETVLMLVDAMDEARAELPGPTVRYEDLTTHPEEVVRQLCAFLEVPWEPEMLDYGRFDHGSLGDYWSANTRLCSGRIQPPRVMPAPDEIPEALEACCQSWGYLDPSMQPTSPA